MIGEISIDFRNRKPIYEQIVDRFEILIVNGVLDADSQLPSVRALAVELSINPVKGRGNFVSGNEKLKLRKQESVYASLRENVKKGQELGISCEEMTEKVQEYYREEKKQE